MPSKRMVSMGWAGLRVKPAMTVVSLAFARVLHVLDHVELDVPQLPVLLLDLAQVDVLHDVAGLCVDVHGAARTFEDLAFHPADEGFAAALAAGLLQRLI